MSRPWFELIQPPRGEVYDIADPWPVIGQLRKDLDASIIQNRHLRLVLAEAIAQLGGELFVSEDQAASLPVDATIRTEGNSDTGLVRVWATQ